MKPLVRHARADADIEKQVINRYLSFWLLAVVPVFDSVFSASLREYGFEFSSD